MSSTEDGNTIGSLAFAANQPLVASYPWKQSSMPQAVKGASQVAHLDGWWKNHGWTSRCFSRSAVATSCGVRR